MSSSSIICFTILSTNSLIKSHSLESVCWCGRWEWCVWGGVCRRKCLFILDFHDYFAKYPAWLPLSSYRLYEYWSLVHELDPLIIRAWVAYSGVVCTGRHRRYYMRIRSLCTFHGKSLLFEQIPWKIAWGRRYACWWWWWGWWKFGKFGLHNIKFVNMELCSAYINKNVETRSYGFGGVGKR